MSRFTILRSINRFILLPTFGFTAGAATFIKGWPDESDALSLKDSMQEDHRSNGSRQSLYLQRPDILKKVSQLALYKKLLRDPDMEHSVQSEGMPAGHRFYHVGQGQLFGPGKLEIDPLIFRNVKDGKIVVFYHLGKELSNEKGMIHKGVLSLLLDEGLCYCGFPKLPNKRGVTARLGLHFEKDIPMDSTIILRAQVTQCEGRKCIIDGSLEAIPSNGIFNKILGNNSSNGTMYVKSNCVLVEPKWFKYFGWFTTFK